VIVLGTGLKECILSGLLSVDGLKVTYLPTLSDPPLPPSPICHCPPPTSPDAARGLRGVTAPRGSRSGGAGPGSCLIQVWCASMGACLSYLRICLLCRSPSWSLPVDSHDREILRMCHSSMNSANCRDRGTVRFSNGQAN
jgi:hypothetical protein